jgi:hypothetical protein
MPECSESSRLDPALLSEALDSAATLYDLGDEGKMRWIVGREIQRPGSFVYPLRLALDSGEMLAAFYKVHRLRSLAIRDGLLRGVALDRKLAEACSKEQITPARVLAAAPDKFVVVTHAVPGRALGTTYRYAVGKQRRRHALRTYERIGRAIRLIEQLEPPQAPISEAQQWGSVDADLDMLSTGLSRKERVSTRAQLQELFHSAVSSARPVFCHGDLGVSNIRTWNGRLGLIDFHWKIMLQGHDLAHFANKIECQAVTIQPWTSALVKALLEGYGEPEFASSASWRFYRLRYLLRQATRPVRSFTKNHWRVTRARRSLRMELLAQ